MFHLGKRAGAQSPPGELALAVGQVVEMLSYWERGIVTASLSLLGWPCEQKGGEGEEVGPLWKKHSHWLVSVICTHFPLEGFRTLCAVQGQVAGA